MSTRWTRLFTAASALCLIAGMLLLGAFGYGMWRGVSEEQHLTQVWRYQVIPHTAVTRAVDPALKRPVDGVDFAIVVPKLKYYAAVKEGTSSGVLYSSPGHYVETVWPGDPGTVGVAAHNVYWIDFPQLTKGDEIDLQTRYGTYRYQVTDTEIVNPDNRTALVPHADGYHLTLTTCWPLWAGAFATQRYIIHTDQVWPTPFSPGYS